MKTEASKNQSEAMKYFKEREIELFGDMKKEKQKMLPSYTDEELENVVRLF